jgi:hypothetical protein
LKQNDGKIVAFLSSLPHPKWIRFVVDHYLLTESTTTGTTRKKRQHVLRHFSTLDVISIWIIFAFIAVLGMAIAWQWRGL